MTLKAVLFDFNGVIIDDESIHQTLVEQILVSENLRPQPNTYQQFCLGRSDRACLKDLLSSRGRVVTEAYLEALVAHKAQSYQNYLNSQASLPLFPGLQTLVLNLKTAHIKLAVVSGAHYSEVKAVLHQAQLLEHFRVIVAADDLTASKPAPDAYWLAIERLNQNYPTLQLQANECLAIEDSLTGIQAAKQAGIPVVGVANTYPFHMLQRQTNWTVDSLADLELERVVEIFSHSVTLTH